MVTLGSLLSNRPELQEVAKVFSCVLKQMDVYLNLECKYTVGIGGGRKHTHTNHLLMCRLAYPLILRPGEYAFSLGEADRETIYDPVKHTP